MEAKSMQIEGIHIPKVVDSKIYDLDFNSYVQVNLCYFRGQNYYEVSFYKGKEEKTLAKVDTADGLVNVIYNNGKLLIYCTVWNFNECKFIPTKVLYLYDIEDDTFHVIKEKEALALIAPSLSTDGLDEHRLTYSSISPYGMAQRAKSMPTKSTNTTFPEQDSQKPVGREYIKLLK